MQFQVMTSALMLEIIKVKHCNFPIKNAFSTDNFFASGHDLKYYAAAYPFELNH